MSQYKLTGQGWVFRVADSARISTVDDPLEPNTNPHYLAYKEWLAEGNTPDPVDPPTEAELRERFKAERAEVVAAIKVTTQAGNTFDGDEISQGRMARAILGLQAAGEGAVIPWVLADNNVMQVTAAELTEALTLAGIEQARLWVGGQ